MITKEQAIAAIDSIQIRDIVKQCYDIYAPGASGFEAKAYLNLDSGEVETHWMYQYDSFRDGNRILIYSLDAQSTANIPDDDIAGDDDIPAAGVKAFPDYNDRLLECLIWYAEEGRDSKADAYHRIEQFYSELEYAAAHDRHQRDYTD